LNPETDHKAGEAPVVRQPDPPVVRDDGLRRLLTWTFIALAVTLLLAAAGVALAVYWFDVTDP
jgi:hypothetical protein